MTTTNPYPVANSSRDLTLVAWVITVLVSALPDILWSVFGAANASQLTYAKMVLLLGLALAASFWPRLRPLRNFFIVLLAFFGLNALRPLINFSVPALQSLFGGSVFDARMQAEQTGKLAVSLLMIAVLLILGYTKHNFFLTRGDLSAPIQPVPLLGFPKPDPWSRFGLQWGMHIAASLAVMMYLGMRPGGDLLAKVVPIIPSIFFYAALNGFNEEITYRSPMLATLEPVAGSKQALWMAAFFFGIGHYFGIPGGIFGGIASIFMGWILGKAMLETRGFFWAWWIHWLSDIVIFTFVTLSMLR